MQLAKLVLGAALIAVATAVPGRAEDVARLNAENVSSSFAGVPAVAAAIALGPAARVPDRCSLPDITASPSRPTWTGGAATTQCGVLESDFGWQWQPLEGGGHQITLPSSMRYGLSPRMDMRWGMPGHIAQAGGGWPAMNGISDQSISFLYRFHDQGRWMPALGLSYGVKIPSANPDKGFGSGYTDHQVTFIASRDVVRLHADFNAVGTVAGAEDHHDGAVQFGLAISLPVASRIAVLLDNYGGAQPGTTDRLGATLAGVSWSVRPRLVLDASYTRGYTACAPRQQLAAGFTYSMRPLVGLIPPGSRLGRLLGR